MLRQQGVLFPQTAEDWIRTDHRRATSLRQTQPVSWSEPALLAIAVALGADSVPTWSPAETALVRQLPPPPESLVREIRRSIKSGADPLGNIFCRLRPPTERRKLGAIYTPVPIVDSMLDWAEGAGTPARVVDPGAGTGRFVVEAGRRFDQAELIGIEVDPVAALLARGHIAAAGLAKRAAILVSDYRGLTLPQLSAKSDRTLYIGNPPYVRHHLIEPKWKSWLVREAAKLGHAASQLAGLHVYFFLETVRNARAGDYGAFVTAAEWLDVNYGKLVRDLFLNGLGGTSITVIEPTALPFPDAATTAAIATFEVKKRVRSVRLRRVESLGDVGTLADGRLVRRERLEAEQRWSRLTRVSKKGPNGYVELGELCRVHRGQVTGANRVWIAGPHSSGLPASVLFRTVTRARELFTAGLLLETPDHLKHVIDLPEDFAVFTAEERRAIEAFLKIAKQMGGNNGYIARHRRTWWSVGLRQPAPILATYMARKPPAFVRNAAAARHLNIAHGIYPRETMEEGILRKLAQHLATMTTTSQGRTYAGGLTKFEPREMERILVPGPQLLANVQ